VVDRLVVRDGIQTRLADSLETALKLAEGLVYLDPADPVSPSSSGEGLGVGPVTPSSDPTDKPHPNPSPEGEGLREARATFSTEDVEGANSAAIASADADTSSARTGVAKALAKAAERAVLQDNAPPGRIVFSEKFACPVSGFTIAEIEPRLFSFNAPQGACPACDGLGEKLLFDPDLVVPNHALSIKRGAVVPWAKSNPPSPYYMQVLGSLAREFGFSLETPWADLPEDIQDVVLHGTKGRPVTLTFVDGRKTYDVRKPFEGVIGNLNRRMLQTESAWMREELSKYQSAAPCETCGGARLRPEPLAVKIAGEDISMSTRRSVRHALAWFSTLEDKLTPTQREIARAILKEINERLGFLNNVGLDYLNLDRTSGTLSGGESQRIRLASQIACSSPSSACATSATPCSSSSMTRTRSATPIM
jgi:excinuclease ABC subunit A